MPFDTPLRSVGMFALMAAAACMGPRSAPAATPGYEVQLGIIESDNIQRLPSGGSSETIGVAELGFNWHEKRPGLDADIDADVSHLNYFQHTYGGEFIGNFLGQARFELAPELLSWGVADNFGQAPLQPLAPITPDNREYLNYFSTGPTLSLPLAQATQLTANAQYGRVDYQHSPLDNTRLSGAVGLEHQLAPTSSLSFNARDESIRFANDQLNSDYDRQEAFARFDARGSRTELGVDVGYGHLHLPGVSGGIPLARVDLSRRVSATSTIGLALGHDYSDGADSFRLVQTVGGATLNTQPLLESGAPFVSNYATLKWTLKLARTTADAAASYYRDRYQTDAALDNDRTVVNASAARQVTPTVQLAATEYLVRWHFDSADVSATQSDTGLQLTWRAGRQLSLFLGYYLSKGASDIAASQYTENRLWLSIGYGQAAEPPPGPAPVRLPGRQ